MQNIETDSTILPFIRERLKHHSTQLYPDDCRAAVLLPLLIKKGELHLLFEQRALSLKTQPGDICYPGGAIELGERAEAAAVREMMEELLVKREQIQLLGEIGRIPGPTGHPVHAFAALLTDYDGRSSPDEVDHVFTLPLRWFAEHPPLLYRGVQSCAPGDDFPFELIPGGRSYPFAERHYTIPLYLGTSPLIWGMTARITSAFCDILRGDASVSPKKTTPAEVPHEKN